MKTRYLMLLLGCLFLQLQSIFSQTENNSLYIPPTDCAVGSLATVPIMLSNDAEIVALQFDMHVPDVVRLADLGITLTDRKNGHTITVKNLGGNNYRVLVFSATNTSLRGNSGALFQLPLTIPKDLEIGAVYAIEFKDVVLSKRNGENVQSGVNDGSIKIVHGNRPDIAVQEIKFISSEIKPGGKVSVAWSVKNVGNQPTKAGWSEQVYLVSESGDEAYIGQLNSEELLSASGVASRQAEFTLPVYPGIDGKVYAKVKLTPYPELGELPVDVANNEASSSGYLTLAKELFLKLNRNPIAETYTSDVYGFLNRSGSRKTEETFTFTNSNPKRMTIPSSVTIPVGESGISFKVRVIDDQIANPDSFIVAKVSGNGYKEVSQDIWIEDNEMPKLTMTAPEDDRKEGDSFKLTIQREWATKWPLAVRLVTDHPKRFQFDPNVVIPANEKSVTVDILAIDDDLPDVTIDAVFTASAYGFENGTGFVKLLDNDLPDIQMEITPLSFSESAGPQAAIASLRRTKVTDNKITVKLTDDSKGTLYYPSTSIVLEKGVTEYQFAIGVVDNDLKDGDRKVKLTAAVYISSCSCSAAGTSAGSVTKELTILDNDGPSLKITSSQTSLIEGKKDATTLTIIRNTDTSQALTVKLTCDKPEDVIFENTVIIPAGKTSVDIPVSVKENSTTEGNRTVTFTVSAEGFSSGVCWAMITDQTLPDAVVSGLSLSVMESQPEGDITYNIEISNEGFALLSKETEVSIYLSQNVNLSAGSYKELLSTLKLQADLAPGQMTQLKETVTLPAKTGDYYIIAVVNENQYQPELVYINNESAEVPLKLVSPYNISVLADKKSYKSGEQVIVTGKVIGAKAANVLLDLYLINRGYRQVFNVKTDAQGQFKYIFKPEKWQMGDFTLGACYPGEGLKERMADFNIYGIGIAPKVQCEVIQNKMYKGVIQLNNLGTLKLTNVKAEVVSIPSDCAIKFESISVIEPNATGQLNFTIESRITSTSLLGDNIDVCVSSAEGASENFSINYYCSSEKGELITEYPSVNTTMTKGTSRIYQLNIANKGAGETGKITVDIPKLAWMSLESPKEMASLKNGEAATIILRMSPTADMDLNVVCKGTIGVNCTNGKGFSLPYNITPVSEATGTLQIDVCDEYTYNTKDAPHVEGAKIRITTPSNKLVAEGVSGKDGLFTLPKIVEGYYKIEVSEDNHSDVFKGTVLVDPGKLTLKTVNLSFQAIQVSWKLEETEIEDKYEIVTDVKFETNVPAPVVVMNMPNSIPAEDLQLGESLMFNVTLVNKGLITAEDVQLQMPSGFKTFTFEPMIQGPFELLPQVAITIPVKVTKIASLLRNLDNDPCVGYPGTLYFWDCGTDRKWHRYEAVLQLGSCKDGIPDRGDGEGSSYPGGWGFGFGSGWFSSAGSYSSSTSSSPFDKWTAEDKGCEPCQNKFLLDLVQCIKPVKVAVEAVKFVSKSVDCVGSFTSDEKDFVNKLKDCPFTQDVGAGLEALNRIYALYNYLINKIANGEDLTSTEKDIIADDFKNVALSAINDLVDHYAGKNKDEVESSKDSVVNSLLEAVDAMKNLRDVKNPADFLTKAQDFFSKMTDLLDKFETTKEVAQKYKKFLTVWKKFDCITPLLEPCDRKEPTSLRSVSKQYPSYIQEFQESLRIVQDGAIAEDGLREEILGDPIWMGVSVEQMLPLLSYLNEFTDQLAEDKGIYLLRPQGVSVEQLERLKERWYNSFSKYQMGGENNVNLEKVRTLLATSKLASDYLHKSDFSNFTELLEAQLTNVQSKLDKSKESVCSTISLQFKQTMTMTRQAFRGTLTVFNGHESIAMKDVRLNLEVKDEEGNTAGTHEFQINTESLETFGGELDGAWTLDAQKTGKATILFIPTKYAAPTEKKNYSFGGTLSYVDPFTNLVVTRDLFPVTMTVKPSPNLDMTYFIQRDILGDDPLTTNKVEPMVPAEFSLLIHNTGAGDATNVNMVTNQPEIIDNEKGLNIKFELLSSQLNGEEHSLALGGSVATAFGTIEAGKTAYAQWWFTSTLLGHFTDYDVKATHVSSYDNPDLSLLDQVTIHELIRSIKVPKTDLAGFLVNDNVDSEDLPDMLYLSDGTIEEVAVAKRSTIQSSGTYQYTLTVIPSESGWNYGSISDPTNGRQTLVSIVRKSDGASIDTRNIWQTSCTLRDGKEPFYENIIHFVDKMGTAQEEYQLTFEPGPSVVLEVSSFEGIPAENETVDKPVTEVTVHFNKEVNASTFTTEDLTLVLQGETQDVSLINIQKVDDQTFVLDLTALTKRDGYYILTVQTTDITDAEGFEGDTGESVNWVQYLAAGSQTLTFSLSTGWNWISTNMEKIGDPITFLSPVKDQVKRLQNQFEELTNDPKYGLTGNLKTLTPKSSYKLEMSGDGKIDVVGTTLTPDQVTIDLNKGWNWIGYIPRAAASPTMALSLLSANANDEIKGQRGFAKFNGTSWVGTLKQMVPGEGYMYYANTKQSFRYAMIYNTLLSASLKSAVSKPVDVWSVDIHKYPNNMSIVADLWDGQVKQEPEVYKVGAFVGEECRGIGQYVDGLLFITVYGEKSGEKISFRAISSGASTEWGIRETVSFGESSLGTLDEPYALHLTGFITGTETLDGTFGFYPNPVSRILYFKGDYSNIKSVSVLNINGVPVLTKDLNGDNRLDVSSLSDGVYILMIKKEKEILYHKIIKVSK